CRGAVVSMVGLVAGAVNVCRGLEKRMVAVCAVVGLVFLLKVTSIVLSATASPVISKLKRNLNFESKTAELIASPGTIKRLSAAMTTNWLLSFGSRKK